MNELFKQAEIEITGTYTKIAEHTQKTLYDLAEFEAQWTAGLLSKNIGVRLEAIGTLTEVQLDAVLSEALIEGAPSSEWWSRQSTKLLNHFKDPDAHGVGERRRVRNADCKDLQAAKMQMAIQYLI